MAVTYEPIASTTLGSDSASASFSSIVGTYTDLILIANIITTRGSGTSESIYLTVNSDTGSNYSATALRGNGSAASSYRESSTTAIYLGEAGITSATDYALFRISLMSYANTSVNKTVLSEFAHPGSFVGRHVGLWRSTSAITSVSLRTNTNNIKAGSSLSLFGVKAA